MFTHIFFLFLILFLIGSAPDHVAAQFMIDSHTDALIYSIVIYCALIGMIYVQNRWFPAFFTLNRLTVLTNVELILFFGANYFLIGSQRLFTFPILAPFNDTLLTTCSLLVYFSTLFFFYFTLYRNTFPINVAKSKAWDNICFTLPFALPFYLLVFVADVFTLIPYENMLQNVPLADRSIIEISLSFFTFFIALLGTLIFLPRLLILFWKCHPLKNETLTQQLDEICRKGNFKHAGFRTWNVMKNSMNAAIVGVVWRYRYIMFTDKLLEQLPLTAIEAILAHEMGHNRYKHLLIYPFILFGMLASSWLLTGVIYNQLLEIQGLKDFMLHNLIGLTLDPLIFFLIFAALNGVYFRLIFGYFSRIFERQADLYPIELQLPAESMIQALDEIACAQGNIHHQPNWHHYSIQERIDFLKCIQQNPAYIKYHHLKVYLSLGGLFLCLSLIAYLWML